LLHPANIVPGVSPIRGDNPKWFLARIGREHHHQTISLQEQVADRADRIANPAGLVFDLRRRIQRT
jgi:hypothetical protein